MTTTVASFRKTAIAAFALAAAAAAAYAAVPLQSFALATLASIVAIGSAAVGASGVVAINRVRRLASGKPDLFLEVNRGCSETLVGSGARRPGRARRLLARLLLDHDFVVGTHVRIKSIDQIRATLDRDGDIGALPFMPEMMPFCGKMAVVFRCVDKIYDYKKSRRLRDLDRCVLLAGLRCDGSAHGGCQARCPLIWKVDWLERVADEPAAQTNKASSSSSASAAADLAATSTAGTDGPDEAAVYRCQFTQLTAATRAQSAFGLRRWLRPLVAGNLSVSAFAIVVATRLFNWAQNLRGGAGFPPTPPRLGITDEAPIEPLAAGEWVRVRPLEEVARTLNKDSKNRGLWFDPDMSKHCGQTHRVAARVEKIIDVASGRILKMKTPSVILEGVDYSGEFLQMSAQHEYLFWREAWLQRVSAPRA